MNKKKVGVLIAGVVILAGMVCGGIRVYIKSNNLSQIISETEARITSVENENKLLQEENIGVKNNNKILKEEFLELQERYDELNKKYQKEISPVKFQD